MSLVVVEPDEDAAAPLCHQLEHLGFEPVAAAEVRAASWVPLRGIADLTTDEAMLRAVAKMRAL